MKKFKKLLSLILVLILCIIVSVGSAACDFSKMKAPDIGGATQTEETGEGGHGENHDHEGGEHGDSQTEIPAGTETIPDNVRFYQYLTEFSDKRVPRNV